MTEVEQVRGPASWPTRIALLHPAWLLLATLAMLLGQVAVMSWTPSGIMLAAVFSLLSIWLVLGWTYGIYRVARESSERRRTGGGPDRGWVFGISAVTLLVLPAALTDLPPVLDGLRSLLGAVGILSLFASFWLAAAALVTAEGYPVRHPTNRAVGTFLLVVYWMIGAWFLRPRILAILKESQPDDQVRLG